MLSKLFYGKHLSMLKVEAKLVIKVKSLVPLVKLRFQIPRHL